MILLWWVHWMEVIYTTRGYLYSLHISTSKGWDIFVVLCPEGSRICLQISFNVKVIRLYAIATCYGLDGPRIESRLQRSFSHPSRPVLWLTQPPVRWVKCLFRAGKAAWAFRWTPPPPFSAEVKERMELYLYFLSGLTWSVQRWYLPLPLPFVRWKYHYTLNFEKKNINTHGSKFVGHKPNVSEYLWAVRAANVWEVGSFISVFRASFFLGGGKCGLRL